MSYHDTISQELGFDPQALRGDLWIDGGWRKGRGGDPIAVIDPSTGNTITRIENASIDDAMDAVAAAEAALPGWAATPPRVKSEILRRCYDLMIQRKDMLARLISLENGKALPDAQGEVLYAAEFFRWFAEEAVRLNGEIYTAPSGANRIIVTHRPIGVAVMVTPWNFPAAMATRKIAPALAAGCTCVLKPATETPLTAYALAEIYAEAGVPPGVVNVLTTSRSGATVSAMLHDPRVRKLSFTGSTEVGRRLLHEAADTVISCSMELGGNAPFIVFDDADLDLAIEGAMVAKMRNGGEACTAANRFLVQKGIAPAFAERLAARMEAMTLGAGYAGETLCGPLINREALDRIAGLVSEAESHGAKTLTGGRPLDRPGFYFPPTVLTDVPPQAEITGEEIFGPVAALATFETEDEAIARANSTEYGLISYVFTSDLARGLRVSERLDSGMVGLNRGVVSDPAAPFGGTKQSGLGREGAHHGILEFCEVQYIAANW
ncbi:NAD-dependent succinate-semialdehyde dehydrogenase [Paracoccus denitrificans]|jgi:succinate-semialdehyde dehydrogenase/glutarate-semialdehyde dehydrogenase|uniref:Succinate semialdehyde dehydrogenase n=1 Tax=Paracoccus denitrificans (strain Pd 1222) TaxID=318586 RepID=A1AYL3_PARDP|nr:NAD-dependent succinate-semialdehyde dehydrogenase [Paracoccus denitrificans]ABL68357.1 succinate semialdehyde dehydrogenase [Paracoccus denitrificans PD1222]MBB4627873.1 succinate-semialdehyde dehydrogenase/glutarate-semialdehyde dehydrogenase [Paracoccus denitrificans]MCU7428592.1 NAD-dependent succinate-semialdehyde dehydrogenase [Paracoccus denitrificans]QAR26439.1 NAD-dependent succinate-semialdehyde dehydrogenase [Paracoccus denitrificans]UPV95376.1 NAD-dependent succinate-semialdehyd